MSLEGREDGLPLWQRIRAHPEPFDPILAQSRVDEFLSAAPSAALASCASQPNIRGLLLALADHSPFLWRLATTDPARLNRCLKLPAEACLAQCLARLGEACAEAEGEAGVMRTLRLAKQEMALLVALADLGGAWDVIAATEALSRAADAFIRVALRHVLRENARAGRLRLGNFEDFEAIEARCGLLILALGKLGGNELNYSSDVDLAAFFDPDCDAISPGVEPAALYPRITKEFVRLLQERTSDGYVFRVDLRLRPDPGSTAVAVSLPAAYEYYESFGQNWERAALIKARPVAGSKALAQVFLDNLKPFIWRKYFDYAAIADIAAMKRQIHAVHGGEEIAVAGHNIKLGRGGIREIEFFVQTQQLVFGGKKPALRGRRTLEVLEMLREEGWVTDEALRDLRKAYLFLREIEHRLQMIADEQTQRLPQEDEALSRFALFCGYSSKESFAGSVAEHLRLVSRHYARLFEHAAPLDTAIGSLVFTGVANDPETMETLSRLGFKEPALASETVRGWHFGRRAAVRGERARETLTELGPALLQAFGQSGDADAALAGFDLALAGMPAATELFSLLKANPSLCVLFGEILGGAPKLARSIINHPHLLDAAIDPSILKAPFGEEAFCDRATRILQPKPDTEEFLDTLRDFAEEESFPIGLRLWAGMIEPSDAALAYSNLAAAVVEAALDHIERVFASVHGEVALGKLAVLALGKLGSREMTATSDLDLIFVYEYDQDHPQSSGPKPLHAMQYYSRLTQRLVSALTVATRRGRLYEVDMRLRPSGRQGPLAIQFSSFIEYQNKEAETWEHMALTRARTIAGNAALRDNIERAVGILLARRRDDSIINDIIEMRDRIASAKGDGDPWDLKIAAGGMIDIDFIAQYLLLRHAHTEPSLLRTSPRAVISAAATRKILVEEDAGNLLDAHKLFTNVTQIQNLALERGVNPRAANEGAKRRLATAGDQPSLSALESRLNDTRARVREIFERILLPP
ncbi:MAG TPA: bifunctional [glutamine synthetase] adenylyltransferase/[glutamine synthetase]-adenylyl-L-tyrosine phosphorylase [Methylocella sp.]|nr:bifunctional [glutamine synthetase] adenylyltransferase/[glutamine synthetase]-adenylyl-L-tyrosine phosphorylase [Methylocella sp.]